MSTERKQQCSRNLEIWGGIECTINRVENRYFDQLDYSGHYERDTDLDLIADLGIKALRYPVLWERHEPEQGVEIDWSWTEQRLTQLREHNIEPIAGLVHHGSGPAFTNLADKAFPEMLAAYAGKVAERFPWIQYYTPVNEPLTTARFSGLYGFWYPHKRNDVSFIRMLLIQVRAVVLSMQAIRKVNPEAKLVQTEDLGKTYSTPVLQYQADFENERRWLTFDLLCGKVRAGHSMYDYMKRLGIKDEELQFFVDNPCPPDIMGMNYYVTSERFLDDDYHKYEPYTHGGNDLQQYADLEACRVSHGHKTGLDLLLKEAWERFQLPMAITESHLNCTRDEQVRWLKETWDTCKALLEEGVDVRAVTSWSILGAFGWNKLLTTEVKDYEVGAFDVRSGSLRPTAIAHTIKMLAQQHCEVHPVLESPGWWKRNIRYIYMPETKPVDTYIEKNTAPLLILGKNGTLGRAFARMCEFRSIAHRVLSREDLNITDGLQIEQVVKKYQPWAIINAAGYVRVDDAEKDCERCYYENSVGPHLLSLACKRNGIKFVTFSSDMVFDGSKRKPYKEYDKVNPLNVYGRSKARAEDFVLKSNPDSLIVRTSSFFGPWDQYNFVYQVLENLSNQRPFRAASDVYISPTYVPDLVNTVLDLLIDNESGIWHLSTSEEITWGKLAMQVADIGGVDSSLLDLKPIHYMNWRAPRPLYTVMENTNGMVMPSLQDALGRFIEEYREITERKLH